jgi:hypothetical protein
MDVQYIKKVQEWVLYDNELLKHKENVKGVVEKKKDLEDEILKYVEDNKYDKLTINISDGNIKFSKRNTTQPLTMKGLRSMLESYQDAQIDVDDLMKHISSGLQVKQKVCMQRDFKSKP